MFQYPPLDPLPHAEFHSSCPLLHPIRPESTQLHPSIPNCFTLHSFAPFSPTAYLICPVPCTNTVEPLQHTLRSSSPSSNSRPELSPTVYGFRFCLCGFLWPFVASRGLLWPFEAFCGIESHRRSQSRVSSIVSESVPGCPKLSHLAPRAFSVRFKGLNTQYTVPGAAPPQLRELVPLL